MYEIYEYHVDYVTVINLDTSEQLDIPYAVADELKSKGLFA